MIVSSYYIQKNFNRLRDIENNLCFKNELSDIRINEGDESIFYIKLFEHDCPICLELIYDKQDCIKTDCNHYFHKSCLHIYLHDKIYYQDEKCPLCRQILNYYPRICVYNFFENFYIYDDYYDTKFKWLFQPLTCDNCKKYIGMNNNCDKCLKYRLDGDK